MKKTANLLLLIGLIAFTLTSCNLSKPTFSVTFNSNQGTEITTQVILENELANEPSTPTKSGYTFLNWYKESTLTNQWNFSIDKVIEDITLYAKWTANTYNVTFDKNNGSTGSDSITATYNSQMPTASAPTRDGYVFKGYYDALSDGTQYYDENMNSCKNWDLANNATLYAIWDLATYTVTFDKKGGTGGSDSIVATYNSIMPSAIIPTRDGFKFEGYYDALSGGTQYYNNNMGTNKTYELTSDITLYAVWSYKLGTIGEAGGYVFSIQGNYSTGWSYLEAAPYGWYNGSSDSEGPYSGSEDPIFQWGYYGQTVIPSATNDDTGYGETNTNNIVSFHDGISPSYYTNPPAGNVNYPLDGTVAAKVCADYSLVKDSETYDDWVLPSKKELSLMYANICNIGIGGFDNDQSTSYYWSSTEENSTNAFYANFVTWEQGSYPKHAKIRVRPIRAF